MITIKSRNQNSNNRNIDNEILTIEIASGQIATITNRENSKPDDKKGEMQSII